MCNGHVWCVCVCVLREKERRGRGREKRGRKREMWERERGYVGCRARVGRRDSVLTRMASLGVGPLLM